MGTRDETTEMDGHEGYLFSGVDARCFRVLSSYFFFSPERAALSMLVSQSRVGEDAFFPFKTLHTIPAALRHRDESPLFLASF